MTVARFRLATDADDADLRTLLRENPMEGWVRLALEREPSFFLGEGLLGDATVQVAREESGEGRLIGACTCTWMPVHVDGEVRSTPYLSGLRLAPAFRNQAPLLRQGFRAMEAFAAFGSAPLAFTSLASDNRRARRLLEAGLPGFPVYKPLGELETWVLPTGGRATGRLERARPADLPDIVQLINESGRTSQFSPHLSEAWLAGGPRGLRVEDFLVRRVEGALQTCLALWDQRAFKQVRVHGYRAPLNILRLPWNLAAFMRRGVRLPAPGDTLEACFLAFASFRKGDPDEAAADISEALACAAKRGVGAALLGLPVGHPLGTRLRKGRAPWIYSTCVEAVAWPEAARAELKPRPIHPEIALL